MKIRVSNGMHQRNIELPLSDSELTGVMKSIGVTSAIPYCTLNTVWGDNDPLHLLERTQVNMDEVNFFAKRMESLTKYEQEVLSVYAERHGLNEMKELINLTFCMPGLSLIKDFSDAKQVGKQLYMDEHLAMSETEREKINFIEFADKTLTGSRVDVLPYGVFVQHGFELQELYDGKNLPLYFYDPDHIVAVLEVCNGKGASEYLYMPTEINAFNKMKARLSVESFSECTVKEVQNVHLPGNLLPKPEDVSSIEQLTAFNELCQNIYRLDEANMEKLSLAAQFIGAKDYMDLTYIAKQLGDFEVVPGVHNDEEYGKFLVIDADLFDVNELLLPHIDYAGVAADKRSGTLADSGYLEGGFVGASKERHEYLQQYHGEYSDPLEFNLDDCETFCLYSPLKGTLMLGGEYSEQEEYLSRYDLTPFESDITEAIKEYDCIGEEPRGLMHYFSDSLDVARKVITAKPMVVEHEGELFGVLECMIKEPLTEEELSILKDYWTGQMSDGWGEGFEQQPIKVEDGELSISFWCSDDSWSVMTEEELCQSLSQGMGM